MGEIMAANQYGINMAEILGAVESIKGARTNNRLAEINLQETERKVKEAPAARAAEEKRKNLLAQTRQQASTGNEEAQRQLLALDPEGAPKFIEAISTMDQKKREQVKQNVEQIGQMSAYVLQGKDPIEQQRRYGLVYNSLPEETRMGMPAPEQYDPAFVELSLSKATTMDQMLQNPKAVQVGNEDILYQGGREIARGERPKKETAGQDNAVKSADESLMYRQAAERMGGVFDEAGNLRALDPQVREKIQAITTEASRIYGRGGVTRSEAVTMAYDIVDKGQGQQNMLAPKAPTNANDPLGIL